MGKSFVIGLVNGILDGKHVERIGPALWLYCWLIDKQTKKDGRVLGGRPITSQEIMKDLGVTQDRIVDWTKRLEGYVETKRTPRGLIFTVKNPKKVIWEKSPSDLGKIPARFGNFPNSNIRLSRTYKDNKGYTPYKPKKNNVLLEFEELRKKREQEATR